MHKLSNRFLNDESGAVTVDWVVLTAAVVGLATVAYIGISASTTSLQTQTAATLDAIER